MNIQIFTFIYRVPPSWECQESQRMAAEALCHAGHLVDFRPYGNALVHRSRNLAVACAATEADKYVFLDDDMVLEESSLVRLVEHDKPVVSALCTTRGYITRVNGQKSVELAVKLWDETASRYFQMDRLKPDKLIEGHFGIGAACLVIRKDALNALVEHHLTARDWVMDNEALFGRLIPKSVRSERVEEERKRKETVRRGMYLKHSMNGPFCHIIDEQELESGEDIGFSTRLRQIGIKPCIDTGVTPGHVGTHCFGVWDYHPEGEGVPEAQHRVFDRKPSDELTPEEAAAFAAFV